MDVVVQRPADDGKAKSIRGTCIVWLDCAAKGTDYVLSVRTDPAGRHQGFAVSEIRGWELNPIGELIYRQNRGSYTVRANTASIRDSSLDGAE